MEQLADQTFYYLPSEIIDADKFVKSGRMSA
jgi:hypothetical protein